MLTVFTIVLNGEPWIRRILPELQKLPMPWQWKICEGVSLPENCTSWCRPVENKWHERHRSIDGTSHYLDEIRSVPGVTVIRQDAPYHGKLHMIREALGAGHHDVVVQLDADELFITAQLQAIYATLMDCSPGTAMQFRCDYWVGPAKKIITHVGYGNMPYEWFRAWRWGHGIEFTSHEPPQVNHPAGYVPRWSHRIVMDHRAYATRQQAIFKEQFYGYAGLTAGWDRLQKTSGPVRLSDYFAHVRDKTVVDDA